jgi:simple sugar transport system substrate-binding protein
MDPTLKVAKKYPNVHFEHCSGYKRDKNMSTYSARWYQGRYIQGIIAAKMSKSGVLGYIGSFPIPEVVSGINATILGAQTINPNIKVKIIWANTWFDPGKEADAAKALVDQGADIIMQHTDSPAAMQVAAERGKFAFGQDSEMIKFGPKAQFTSILDTWAPYYIARVKAELDGTWKESNVWGGLDSKMFEMAPYTNMPAGKLQPFKCPVMGQDGKELECKGGDHLADEQIASMNYYIKGVDDKLPGK